ncbi:tripartite tricarboxylate transporter TctB family protein [Teichococcus aestuarii]|uniref:tripartite tricarboxylate transporter TctB family protein n=1 Tax=Teichococcus aestuarii TaxID=568898 RepID=UPI00360C9A77
MSDQTAPQDGAAVQSRADRLAHLVIVALVGAVAVGVIVTALGFPASPDPNDVGPARFPILYATGLLGLLGILLAQTLRQPVAEVAAPERRHYGRVALGMLLMLGALLAIGTVGYFPTAFVLLAGLMALMGQRSLVWNPVLALAITAAIYILFDYGLNVPLPPGSLFE